MTYRDPLYDPNLRPEGSTLEEQIENTVNQTSDTENSSSTSESMREQGEKAVSQTREKGGEAMEQAREKAGELSGTAHEKTDEGIDKASAGLSSAADALRKQGEHQSGQVGNVATTAADKLESASGYLRERDSDQIVSDLEDLVRRKPVESLLVAAGVGLLLSRIFS
jgi:ElaB/YqjD/DUF883 family membrane-anchored ribosome-binding protein